MAVEGVAVRGDSDIGRAEVKISDVLEPVVARGMGEGEKDPEPGTRPPFAE